MLDKSLTETIYKYVYQIRLICFTATLLAKYDEEDFQQCPKQLRESHSSYGC